jgi:hypothetical protein
VAALMWIIAIIIFVLAYTLIGALLTTVTYRSKAGRRVMLAGFAPTTGEVAAGIFLWPLMLGILIGYGVVEFVERMIERD